MLKAAIHTLLLTVVIGAAVLAWAREPGARVEYVGGTQAGIRAEAGGNLQAIDEQYLAFYTKGASLRVAYDRINLLEYGQKVDRRYAMAVLISPVLVLSKKRQHFLTVGYTDENGREQALVFRVEKGDIRAMLATLEARTGRKVQFQDQEARKAGRS